MSNIEAVFEGGVFRPTGPVALAEGSRVIVVVDDASASPKSHQPHAAARRPMVGSAKGVFQMAPDFDAPLEEFEEYM